MPAAQEKPTGLVTSERQPAVDPSLLPPASDPQISLEQCNTAEYEQTWRLNCSEWSGFLSEASYLDRELCLIDAELTKAGAATGWILTSPELVVTFDGSRPILAACETLRKNAYLAKDGNVSSIISHGIGSVFTRPEHRGRGYGAKMIAELSKKLATHQQVKSNKGTFSVLYSDIGPKFYAKHGWKPFPSTHITLAPIDNRGEYHQRWAEITPTRQIADITLDDLERLTRVFTRDLEKKLAKLSKDEPNKTYVAFKPELAQFTWHFLREEFLAQNLNCESPAVKGAIDTATGIAMVWTRTYSAEAADWHLSVLYVHVPKSAPKQEQRLDQTAIRAALGAILLKAQWEAKQWDMKYVEVWDPSEDCVAAAKSVAKGHEVNIIARDQEHICSLKWNGDKDEEVVWLANERYAWC